MVTRDSVGARRVKYVKWGILYFAGEVAETILQDTATMDIDICIFQIHRIYSIHSEP